VNIGGVDIGGDAPCVIVAELSNNHNGDKDRLGRLIDAAQAAGADIVKFQAYTPDELVALRGDGPAPAPWGDDGTTMRQLYERAQTPLAWFPDIAAHCARVGMPGVSSVFGRDSLAVLEACGCQAYKIAKFEHRKTRLRAAVFATGKPMIVSQPDHAHKHRNNTPAWVLYCPGGYPCAPADVHLPDRFLGDMIGLSSHCLDPRLPVAAVARGAKVLEYHVQLDDEPSALERDVSLTMTQLAQLVKDVRATEAMLA
jgi:sialic acid synthase SpsE